MSSVFFSIVEWPSNLDIIFRSSSVDGGVLNNTFGNMHPDILVSSTERVSVVGFAGVVEMIMCGHAYVERAKGKRNEKEMKKKKTCTE